MIKEDNSMIELHKIREQLYKENKSLSIEEKIKKTNASIDRIEKKYKIKFKIMRKSS